MPLVTSALLCLVVAFTDGDTLKVRCGEPDAYQQVTVRLAQIDAPEKKQPFGQRSKEALSTLCFDAWATLTPTARDRYGRTVARVQCDGVDANAAQVRAGMAWSYTRYLTDAQMPELEQRARANRAGLWRDAAPVAPWDWRAEKKVMAAARRAQRSDGRVPANDN